MPGSCVGRHIAPAALFCTVVALTLALATAAIAHAATRITQGVELIPGRFLRGQQPDGNSVILHAPDGLVVFDMGRHPEHAQQIVDYARAANLPIRAVINSHWHLDHVGGNPALRAAYPDLRVYANHAIDTAMHGFLASSRAQLQAQLARPGLTPEAEAPLRAELALIDRGNALYPDVVIAGSATRDIARRRLDLHLEVRAVTAGDVWVFDPATRILAAGDLVTLPVPFLDTACPKRWQAALAHLAAVDFATLVPGHGAPMDRLAFATYRRAYDHLLACAAGDAPKAACVDGWLADARPLLGDADPAFVRSLLDYYLDTSLRGDPQRRAKLCSA